MWGKLFLKGWPLEKYDNVSADFEKKKYGVVKNGFAMNVRELMLWGIKDTP